MAGELPRAYLRQHRTSRRGKWTELDSTLAVPPDPLGALRSSDPLHRWVIGGAWRASVCSTMAEGETGILPGQNLLTTAQPLQLQD